MNQKSSKFSFIALGVLLMSALFIFSVIKIQSRITASSLTSDLNSSAIPFKQGDNLITVTRSIDLSGRIIGLNGSLMTLEEAKRRGVITGVVDEKGEELGPRDLISPGSSFIIRVKDISSSPALFF